VALDKRAAYLHSVVVVEEVEGVLGLFNEVTCFPRGLLDRDVVASPLRTEFNMRRIHFLPFVVHFEILLIYSQKLKRLNLCWHMARASEKKEVSTRLITESVMGIPNMPIWLYLNSNSSLCWMASTVLTHSSRF